MTQAFNLSQLANGVDSSGKLDLSTNSKNPSWTTDITANGLTVGKGAGSATGSTAIGVSALQANTSSGVYNTALGFSAMYSNTSATRNTAVGAQSLYTNTTGEYNCAFGLNSLQLSTTSSYNAGFGYNSLNANTTGANNTAIGSYALNSNTTAFDNTAVGYKAAYANTTGAGTIAFGGLALTANTTGASNVAMGYSTLGSNTTGSYNVGFGQQALSANTTASNNTAVGYQAGAGITTGAGNVIVGSGGGNVGTVLTTGSSNTLVGYQTNVTTAGATFQHIFGYQLYSAGDNGYITMGDGAGTNRIYCNYTANATWIRVSDARIKKDIQDSDLGLDFINKLRTVTYKKRAPSEMDTSFEYYNKNDNDPRIKTKVYGFIAQEVKQALDEVGATDFNGWHEMESKDKVQGVSYEMFVIPLVKAIQDLKAIVDAQAAEIAKLKAKVGI